MGYRKLRKYGVVLCAIGLIAAGSVRAGHVEQRLSVGAVVISPCTVDSMIVSCPGGQQPEVRVIDKATLPSDQGGNASAFRDNQSPASSRYVEVSF